MRNISARFWGITLLLIILLVAAVVGALLIGAAQTTGAIVWEIRAPRVVIAVVVGAGLGMAGALLQGTLHNPLADPGIIGVSASAALGAVIAVALGASYGSWLAAVGATLAGLCGMWLVLWIARAPHGRSEVVTVILAGVSVTAFAAATLSAIVAVSDTAGTRSATFWTTGSLSLATWPGVWSTLPFAIVGAVIAMAISRRIDVLSLGDRAALTVGVNVHRTRLLSLGAAVLLVAAGVAVVGVIAFVGLVVPHAVRLLIGPRHGPLLLDSALLGALLLLAADTVARTVVSPVELPLGVVTAIVGAPIFIVLLRRTRAAQGGWA